MHKILTILVLIGFLGVGACASANQERSAATGAILGAGAGAVIGHQFGQRDAGALIGGALGGTAGLFHGQNEDLAGQPQGSVGPRPSGPRYMGPGPRRGGPMPPPNDDFRNPYIQPDQRYCNGNWVWNAPTAYWICK